MPRPLRSCLWVVVAVAALAWLAWSAAQRARHVQRISEIGLPADASSSAHTRPQLIVPDRIATAYAWLAETQQMIRQREPRVRRIEYENAPYGRELAAASPYRWWLGIVAVVDHLVTGHNAANAVERAALIADPLFYALALIVLVGFVAWRFGAISAAAAAIALGTLFPLTASGVPGAPSDRALIALLNLAALLVMIAGLEQRDPRRLRAWFAAAGTLSGVALWVSPSHAIVTLLGVTVAAFVVAWLRRAGTDATPEAMPGLPWRAWAAAGASVTLIAYLIEYFPGYLGSWELRAVHPIYGVAWFGAGEILAQLTEAVERRRLSGGVHNAIRLAAGIAAVAALGVAMWKTHQAGFLAVDLSAFRLANLADAPVAPNVGALLHQPAQSVTVAVLLLPLLLLAIAVGAAFVARLGVSARCAIVLAAMPCAVVLAFACRQIAWWADLEALLVVAVVALAYGVRHLRLAGPAVLAATIILCVPGLLAAWPRGAQVAEQPSEREVFALIDRDLADWLRQHTAAGTATFIAPPNDTVALSYYGAGRGIATLSWQNKAGLEAAVRILSASTPEEAKALIERRGITHLILPSWDPYLDEYARMGMGQLDGTFLQRLHEWRVPAWLRPVAYTLPRIPGFERQTVTLFEVVEEQSDALALSRTAEFFLELQRLPEASAVGQHLRRFPADMNAWIARAEVDLAAGDEESVKKSLGVLLPYLQAKRDRNLPWDLRVGLAVVLARTKHTDQAKQQVQRAVAEANEPRLRSLSTGALYRLLVLARAYDAPFKQSQLAELARSLLPAEARQRL